MDIVELIKNVEVCHKYSYNIEALYKEKYAFMRERCINILDIGKSSREHYDGFISSGWGGNIATSDINQFDDYPDFVDDICATNLESSHFDGVICNSVLEHVYDPKKAVENIHKIMKDGGIFIGQIPFLYQYHAPSDLKFQDYYRFSRDGIVYLFREFSEVRLYTIRGRVSSVFNLFGFWKYYVEKKIGRTPNIILDKLAKISDTQVSGYVVYAVK